MEALQLLRVSLVQGPYLSTIEKAGENDRPVHLELRGLPDVVLVQAARLLSLLITLPRYLKSPTAFRWVPSIKMMGRWATEAGAG